MATQRYHHLASMHQFHGGRLVTVAQCDNEMAVTDTEANSAGDHSMLHIKHSTCIQTDRYVD